MQCLGTRRATQVVPPRKRIKPTLPVRFGFGADRSGYALCDGIVVALRPDFLVALLIVSEPELKPVV